MLVCARFCTNFQRGPQPTNAHLQHCEAKDDVGVVFGGPQDVVSRRDHQVARVRRRICVVSTALWAELLRMPCRQGPKASVPLRPVKVRKQRHVRTTNIRKTRSNMRKSRRAIWLTSAVRKCKYMRTFVHANGKGDVNSRQVETFRMTHISFAQVYVRAYQSPMRMA